MRLATVRRTSLRWRSISSFVIESTFGPRKYGVTWSRASAESRPETNNAEQRIFAVPATFQLSGSFGGNPGCAREAEDSTTSPIAAHANCRRMNFTTITSRRQVASVRSQAQLQLETDRTPHRDPALGLPRILAGALVRRADDALNRRRTRRHGATAEAERQ